MTKKRMSPAKLAFPLACTVAAGFSVTGWSQEAAAEPEKMDKVIVTGSNIPTAESVGAAPIDVVTAEQIQQVAPTDTLDLLKKTTPLFMGASSYGQEVNNGGSGESYASIRNLPTLVLLNGRRMGNSGFSNGTAVDLNSLPVSMIERIEVFKDGASAVYGSAAIGGVINVIMKKDFNGAEISGRYGFSTESSNYYEINASVVGGIATEKGWIAAGAEYYYSTPLLTKSRDFASMGILDLAAKGLNPPTYVSPTYPGRIDNTVLAGSPYAIGSPKYNPAINTIPSQYLGQKLTTADLVNAGVLIPLAETPAGKLLNDNGVGGYPLINTTLLDTYSVQEQDRNQFWANFEQELVGRGLMLFGQFLYSDSTSTAQLAAAPGSYLGLYNLTIPADNPYNPFGIALGADGAGSPRIRQRFIDVGPRTFTYDSSYYQFVGGLKGDITTSADWVTDLSWEASFDYNLSDQLGTTANAPSAAQLNLALQPDFSADPSGKLSKLRDSAGVSLPTYNYFALATPGLNDPRTISALNATLYSQATSEMYDWNAVFRGSLWELPAGRIGFAAGMDYRYESLSLSNDYLTTTGQAIGLNASGGFPGGSQDTWDGYMEVRVPIFSEKNKIPVFSLLEISAAGRYESVDPGGDSAVPQIGLKWQPIGKQVTLRGTYSEGFLAPSVYSLYGPAQENFPTVSFPDGSAQASFVQQSSPDLKNSTSTTWTGGVVISPEAVSGLTVSCDYYNIDNPGIYFYDWQGMTDSLNALGSASPFANKFKFADGTSLNSTAPNQVTSDNWGQATIKQTFSGQGGQWTDGFDLTAVYQKPTDNFGTFTLSCTANLTMNYEVAGLDGIYYQYAGQYTANIYGAQGMIPDFVVVPALNWNFQGFNFNVSARYIPSTQALGDLHPAVGGTEQGFTTNGQAWTIDPYYSIDMQLAYEFGRSAKASPWVKGLRLAVGVSNLTDTEPSLVPDAEDNTDKQSYSVIGRMIYFQASKKF